MMVYTLQQIDTTPILTNNFKNSYTAAIIVISLTAALAVVYIGYQYFRICILPVGKLWRSYIFLVFSSIFIVALFIIIATNSLMPYNYSGSAIFLVYGFVNVYVYYLQYMYTITREEADKLDNQCITGEVEDSHESLTLGTLGEVYIDINDDKIVDYPKYSELMHDEDH